MRRDMDLIRQLLIAFESWEPRAAVRNPDIEGYDRVTIDHHVYLMWTDGLVEAIENNHLRGSPHKTAAGRALTSSGQKALAVMRDDTVWAKTKAAVAKVGGASIPIWIDLAATYTKEQLGLK